ncbi:MAG: phytanoyl-CoA dioxygenase family protein [Candidatus Eremiobacteraeota bacterium]|nr:phytanoyl-CoA dioxygenase family protein [Candidatus Eremiobacteraeota bacterium]
MNLGINDSFEISPQTRSDFGRDGFVRLKDVLPPSTIEFFRRPISEEVLHRNSQTKPLHERDTYHKAFLQVTNLWCTNRTVRDFVFGKRLAGIAAQLLNVQRVRLYHDQALYKEPGGGITPWHADQYYWPLDSERTCTAWIPLQDTPLEMGPIAFAAGSHQVSFGRDLEISDESERSLSAALASGRFHHDQAAFEIGDVSFHSGWLFHHTGENNTDRPRAVYTVIYMAEGTRLIEPQRKAHIADWEAFMPGVKVGELAASPLNPLLN